MRKLQQRRRMQLFDLKENKQGSGPLEMRMKESMYKSVMSKKTAEIMILQQKLYEANYAKRKSVANEKKTKDFLVGLIIFMLIENGLLLCYLMG